MRLMKLTTVVFDMDGVIFDSERTVMEEWFVIAKERGLEDMEKVYISVCGTTRPTTEAMMKQAYGRDFPFDELDRRAYHMRDLKYEKGLPLKPGIRELLSFLKENGIHIALATSTNGERTRVQMETVGLWQYFDTVVTGEMVTHSKPDPEIFLKAIARSGAQPSQSIIIEDSFNGVKAGRSSGALVIMVPDLRQPDEELEGMYDYVFPDLKAVKDFIQKTYAL